MPSPIAHIATGVAIGLVTKRPLTVASNDEQKNQQMLILRLAVLGSVLPDVDAFVGILMGNFGKYHNNVSHSLAFGLIISLAVTASIKSFSSLKFNQLVLPVLIGYSIHVLMDATTITRGVMLFWPLTEHRYASPFPIFYGVRWSEGLFSPLHLITIATEGVYAIFVLYFAKRIKL